MGRRLALLIGNNAYTGTSELYTCINDATDMAACLAALCPPFAVTVVPNATRRDFLVALEAFIKQVGNGDEVVVFFSGHGQEDGGKNLLLPVDALIPRHDGIELDQILRDLNLAGLGTTNVVLLDACRSNDIDTTWRAKGGYKGGLGAVRNLERDAEFVVGYACEPGTVALSADKPGAARNSPYTAALLRCLPKQQFSVSEMLREVREKVFQASGQKQRPTEFSNILRRYSFVPLPAHGALPSHHDDVDPEISELLQRLQLAAYTSAFAAAKLDMSTLCMLPDADLAVLLPDFGPRRKLWLTLHPPSTQLFDAASSNNATPPPPPAAAASAARPLGLDDLRRLPPRLESFWLSAAVVLQGGVVVVEGGYGVQASRYDINNQVWTDLPDRPHKDNWCCSSCVLNGQLYLLGGGNSDEERSAVQCFDPVTNVWSAIANLPHTHDLCGAAVLDGCLYVCGGRRNVACYDPARKTWAAAAPMPVDVQYCSVVALADSIFVVVGDVSSKSALVRYSPATRAWTELANLPLPRRGCAAVAFNGLLYVMGGRGDVAGEWSAVSDCWSYNPSTNIWTGIAPMPRSHGGGARGFVVHDCIWVVGGGGGDATIRATFECYSPATNDWRP